MIRPNSLIAQYNGCCLEYELSRLNNCDAVVVLGRKSVTIVDDFKYEKSYLHTYPDFVPSWDNNTSFSNDDAS